LAIDGKENLVKKSHHLLPVLILPEKCLFFIRASYEIDLNLTTFLKYSFKENLAFLNGIDGEKRHVILERVLGLLITLRATKTSIVFDTAGPPPSAARMLICRGFRVGWSFLQLRRLDPRAPGMP
jgi:hypothetical protein